MSEEIFKKLNQKIQYPELDHFSTIELTELHQKQDENDSRIIYVDIRYIKSLEDKHNNHISGGQGYQQFTVLIKNNAWYIINLVEPWLIPLLGQLQQGRFPLIYPFISLFFFIKVIIY